MERDYFKDRPLSVQYRDNLYINALVFICLKDMQRGAKELKHLTLTKITKNLTSTWQHPRGQKIKGNMWLTDKYGNPKNETGEEVVGRCTYILEEDEFSVETKDGIKCIRYNEKKDEVFLSPLNELKGYFKIILCFAIGDFQFSFNFCPYLFFKTQEEAVAFANTIDISDIHYQRGSILFNFMGENICQKKYQIHINEKRIAEADAFPIICNYDSINEVKFEINKIFLMDFTDIQIVCLE